MSENRAIPAGYMTVGQAAKRMGVTVRTLQYYDREGLLSPSAESEGGRRLYTDRDLVQLHQILSLKSLGFSLEDIRVRLRTLKTPEDVALALSQQVEAVRSKITGLTESLGEIEKLREEVLQMQAVDFKKYADIIVNLQMKNGFYTFIKHFDDQTLEHIRSRFDMDSSAAFGEKFNALGEEILAAADRGLAPDSETVQALAKGFWDLINEFTGGDMTLLPKLMELGDKDRDSDWGKRQARISDYIQPALGIYLASLGVNPFGEVQK